MKKYEDFMEGLQQDVRIPDKVWAQYEETLADIEHLAEKRKGAFRMKKGSRIRINQKARGRKWAAAAAAGALLTCAGVLSYTNPAAASKIPIIGKIFEQVGNDVTYSGNYAKKEVLHNTAPEKSSDSKNAKQTPANADEKAPEGVYSAENNGIAITASEVYCDGYSIYLTAQIDSKQGGFYNIPSHYTRRFGEKTSKTIYTSGSWKTDGEETLLCNNNFEGKAVDNNTFIGMVKLDLEQQPAENGTLHLSFSEIGYDSINALSAEDILPNSQIKGSWNLTVPFSVDEEQTKEIPVNKKTDGGWGIQKVFVSPYQVIVFSETPYTTLTPDTYTKEDFERQWGAKNKEITAAGENAVTYEEALAEKRYAYCELAVFNQDGEPLETMYGTNNRTLFAVQGHELSKLHIYMTDDSHEFELTKADTEQAAKELSILDVEIDL